MTSLPARSTATPFAMGVGMAFRSVSRRLTRDFWVRPSEASIRRWSKAVLSMLELDGNYQEWVLSEFSGILWVDEVYQGQLALLVAGDPAAPHGDRLIGYQLVQEHVASAVVEQFLQRLASMGIRPAEVITDGSSLYPQVQTAVWPQTAQQLCLFHETRYLTTAAMAVSCRYQANALLHLRGAATLPHLPADRLISAVPDEVVTGDAGYAMIPSVVRRSTRAVMKPRPDQIAEEGRKTGHFGSSASMSGGAYWRRGV